MNLSRFVLTVSSLLVAAGIATAGSALLYQLDQTPVTGTGAILDATGHSAGTLTGSGPMPTLVSGARSSTTNAWSFSPNRDGRYISVSPSATTKLLGDIHQTTGLTVGMWLNWNFVYNVNWQRAAGMNGVFDVAENVYNLYMGFGTFPSLSTGGVFDGNWHHVLLTADFRRSTNNLKLYVDANLKSTGSILVTNSFAATGSSLILGARGNGSGQWPGDIDQFVVFTNALSAAEVLQLYNLGTITNYAPLVMAGADSTLLQWTDGTSSMSVGLHAVITDEGLPNPPGQVSSQWTLTSGPAGVTFDNPASTNLTATLVSPGIYVLRCTASDGALSDYDEVTVQVLTNAPPVIKYLGASPSVVLNTNGVVSLTAVASDDALPIPPGTLSCQWSLASGPAGIAFGNPAALNTTATLGTIPGLYVLQLQVSDGALVVTTNLTINVVTNFAPVPNASADVQTLLWPANTTTLRGIITDDARPNPPGVVTCFWTQVSGPAAATLATPASTNCNATFPALGQYTLRLVAGDGVLLATNDTYVTVWSPLSPWVNAGSSRPAWLPNATVPLLGSYTNTTGLVTVAWSKGQGPGPVVFSNPSALATTASFTTAGKYRLVLTVTNGTNVGQDDLIIEVYDANSNFGYTTTDLMDFTNDLGLTFDYTGLAWPRVKPPPPAYTHPRILLNPEDLPDLRRRLTTGTVCGPVLMNSIRNAAATLTGSGATFRAAYDALAQGDPNLYLAGDENGLAHALMHEAFRVLIDNDAAGGAKAAAALATIADERYQYLLANSSTDWQGKTSGSVYDFAMGYAYDYLYNFMTPGQQASVRRMLALATANQYVIGLDALPGFNANCSNWIPLCDQSLLMDLLAIEGETGYDANVLLRFEALYDRMCSAYVFADGAIYEGMGKGWIGCEAFWVLARRGAMNIATPNARNHIRQFYLHLMETAGYGFTWDEVIGGSNGGAKVSDIVVMKYLYPNDPVVDFIYRNSFGPGYTNSSSMTRTDSSEGRLLQAICAQDYDTSLTWDQALAQQVRTNVPLTAFFNNRGLLVTRSSWTTNGARLYFQPRSEPGGHSEPDRNNFCFSALGRIWAPLDVYGSGSQSLPGDPSLAASVMRIDDVGPSTVPAAVVDFNDSPNFTFAAGDAEDCYSMQFGGTTTPVSFSYNQKLFYPSPLAWANRPWGLLPHWQTSQNTVGYWQGTTPTQRAFRTAGLVRGTTPYALIVDDIQRDNAVHTYTWRMMLANDLTSVTVNGNDAIVNSPDGSRLLVRVLSSSAAPVIVSGHQYWNWPALDIYVTNVAPDLKVMLLPYTGATPPVTTTWSNTVLTVQMADGQKDRVYFTPCPDGRTRVAQYRIAGQGAVLAPPTGLSATAGNAQAGLSWNSVSGAQSYNLRSATVSGGPYALVATNVTASAYACPGLTNGLTYYWVVSAVSANGESENSSPAFATPLGPPPAPALLRASASNQVVFLNWTASFGATGYQLQRSLVSGSNYTVIAANCAATNYNDTTVTNGTSYYYVVSALNANGVGPASAEVGATPTLAWHMPADLLWQGNLANIWDQQNPANLPWLNNGTNVTFYSGDTVTFTDTGYHAVPVNLVGALAPAGVVEVNTSAGYTFDGSGKLTGSCSLQKDGTGTLTILTENDYSGGTTINSGTLMVGSGGTNGTVAGDVALSGGNLTYARTDTCTQSGLIHSTSAGSVLGNSDQSGPLTLWFADGSNTFSALYNSSTKGPLVLCASPNSTNAIATGIGLRNLNATGTLKFLGGTWTTPSLGNNSGFNWKGTNIISDGATVIAGGGRFTWGINVLTNGGTFRVTADRLSFESQPASSVIAWQLQPGGTLDIWGNSYGTTIGNSSANATGYLHQTGGRVLIGVSGSGNKDLTIGSSTASYTAYYNLFGGLLKVGGTVKAAVSSGGSATSFNWTNGTLAVNVFNAAGFLNQPTNSLVNNGGTLAPGDLGTAGKTTITGNYAVSNPVAALAVDIGGTSQANAFTNSAGYYDFLAISGTATLNGTLNVSLINGVSNTVTSANSFTVLSASGGLTGTFANIGPNGRLYVAADPARSFQVLLKSNAPASVVLTNYGLLQAAFTATPGNGSVPLRVTFTDTSASTGTITNRFWDFGDGYTTNTAATTLTHTFSAPASNLVSLLVSGTLGFHSTSQFVVANAPATPPGLGPVWLSGGNLVFSGTNGAPGATCFVLSSTNLALPLTNWTPLATNQFAPDGTFNFTNPLNSTSPQRYYRLKLP